ncbi:MAG: helix-turn-helix transcriptional regulator [Kutzneria sp.]|nr:helix-turn-helix transcriptional regulator [Kutzneria sp.]MBV9844240.1 helix-turn-helix transcriptional regulator [Kutzneria sp.]
MPDRAGAVSTVEFATADIDEAHEYLLHAYGDMDLHVASDQDDFWMRHTVRDAGRFRVSQITNSMVFDIEARPLGNLLIVRVQRGTIEHRGGAKSRTYGVGEVFLAAEPNGPYGARLNRLAMELTDVGPDDLVAVTGGERPPRFTGHDPVSPAAARHLVSTISFAANSVFDNPEAAHSPLLVGATSRMLAATILTTFPNDAVGVTHVADRIDAHPDTLRRAISYIETDAHLDISVADIARAAYVTTRAVQLAFRRHLGTTPMAYLRRVRLDCAHRALMAADPTSGATVTGIAARWGFANPGRFATHYRAAYGVSPRDTLNT